MKKDDEALSMARALSDMVLEADSESLRTLLSEIGVDVNDLVLRGRIAVDRAISSVEETKKIDSSTDEHEGLRILIRLLRRRDNLSEEQLAERARVDIGEVRRIEYDPAYTPLPRTIFQLEQFFNLPKRSLVKLAGMTRELSPDFNDQVLRFAASAKSMEALNREERRILSAFVLWLNSRVNSEGE